MAPPDPFVSYASPAQTPRAISTARQHVYGLGVGLRATQPQTANLRGEARLQSPWLSRRLKLRVAADLQWPAYTNVDEQAQAEWSRSHVSLSPAIEILASPRFALEADAGAALGWLRARGRGLGRTKEDHALDLALHVGFSARVMLIRLDSYRSVVGLSFDVRGYHWRTNDFVISGNPEGPVPRDEFVSTAGFVIVAGG